MKVILSDVFKFQKISIQQNEVLNNIVHMENRIINVLRKLNNKKIIFEKKYGDLYLVSLSPAILYGPAKTQKPVKNAALTFRPISSAISIPTYKL